MHFKKDQTKTVFILSFLHFVFTINQTEWLVDVKANRPKLRQTQTGYVSDEEEEEEDEEDEE